MIENRHFVRSTNLSDKAPALIGGSPAVLSYRAMIEKIEALAGREAASLFAEPVLPHNATSLGTTVSWYCAYEGAAVALGDIDGVGQRPVAQKLSQRLDALGPVLRDPMMGPAVSAWLNLSSPSDILSIGGEPVLVDWGFMPKAIGADDAGQLAQHFARTLGRYAPSLKVPPIDVPAISAAAPPAPAAVEPGIAATGAAHDGPGLQPAPPSAADTRHRPWLGPLIATVVAAAALFMLLLPGVLVYPASDRGEWASFEEARLHASNDSLEAQLKALQGLSQQHLCRLRDTPIPVPWLKDKDASNAPEPRMDPLPRAPEQVTLPRSPNNNPSNATNVGELLDRATVMIFGLKPPEEASQGTGFFIDDRHIVTNHHVILGVSEANIFIASRALGGIRRARLIAKTEPPPSEQEIRPDFAVLEVAPIANNASLRLGVTPPKLSTAYIAGFPGFITQRDLDFRNFIDKLSDSLHAGTSDEMLSQQRVSVPSAELKYGRVNNTMSTGRNAIPVVIHDMQLAPGNSGGPLIDACGRLGGVNTLLFRNDEGAQQANVAQDVSMLRKFLTDNHISFVSDDGPCNPEVATNTPRPGAPQTSPPPTGSK